MMQRLLLLGLNHTTAPLALRELLAYSADERRALLLEIRQRHPDCEAVLLSTCNRVELYIARAVHGAPRPDEMLELLTRSRDIDAAALAPHTYHKAQRDVVDHLFAVASSLDSMVIGETQILGQVREAYEFSSGLDLAGAALHPLFQRAISVGKQVMTQTTIGEGRLSMASVAVDCARQIFDHFDDKTVLSIGAGKIASLVLQSLAALKPQRLLVSNRDAAKAQALAAKFAAEAAPFDSLDDHLVAADIVLTSTGATDPIITRSRFEALLKQRRYRPIFLIDIALPRDVEPSVGKLENVYLYNIDDLQQVVAQTRSTRSDAIDAARRIISEQVERFLAWHQARELGPVIDQLYTRHHDLAQQELARTLSRLGSISDTQREQLEELTRRIVNKLLHDPVKALRDSGEHAAAAPYLHALEKLFQLTRANETREGEAPAEPRSPANPSSAGASPEQADDA